MLYLKKKHGLKDNFIRLYSTVLGKNKKYLTAFAIKTLNAYLFYSPAQDRLTSMNEDLLEGGSEAFRLVESDKVTSSRL